MHIMHTDTVLHIQIHTSLSLSLSLPLKKEGIKKFFLVFLIRCNNTFSEYESEVLIQNCSHLINVSNVT